MIDIHSHILPLVDDGSNSADMSLDMLYEAYRDGTKEIVLTLHLAYAYGFENPNYKIKELFGQFKDIVEDVGIPIKMYLGCEFLYRSHESFERHFEAIQINPDIAVEIVNRGGYLQMNKGSILGDYGSLVKETVKNLLENKLIHFVGSDAHNLRSRHPRMYESYVQVKTRFGSDYAQRIFKENGKILLNGGKV